MEDEQLLERIAGYAELKKGDTVLEVGAGSGNLTEKLLEAGCRVVAVERDKNLFEELEQRFEGSEKLTLIQGDALKVELPDFNKVVSNLPYSISKKITVRLLAHGFDVAVVTVQKEFARKLIAEPLDHNWRFIGALAQSTSRVELLEGVSPQAFTPQPRVSSTVVRLSLKSKPSLEYIKFLRDLFNLKNKKVRNILKVAVPAEFEGSRPAEMTASELARLFEHINKL